MARSSSPGRSPTPGQPPRKTYSGFSAANSDDEAESGTGVARAVPVYDFFRLLYARFLHEAASHLPAVASLGLGTRMEEIADGTATPAQIGGLLMALRVRGGALDEIVVDGVETTVPLFRALLRDQDVIDGNYSIKWLEEWLGKTE